MMTIYLFMVFTSYWLEGRYLSTKKKYLTVITVHFGVVQRPQFRDHI